MKIHDMFLSGPQHYSKTKEIRLLLETNREILLNGEVNNGICYDGIIDEEAYLKSPVRVLVLLKETNGNDKAGNRRTEQNDWDYLYWLKHQQVDNEPLKEIDKNGNEIVVENVFYQSTFKKLCQWLTILFDIAENKNVSVDDFFVNGKIDISCVRHCLNNVALMNLKKSWGHEQTDFRELCAYANDEKIKPILLEEIKLIRPKIVLCCSPDVYYIAAIMHGKDKKDHIKIKSDVLKNKTNEMFIKGRTIYVNFYHPQGYSHTEEQFARYAIEVFNWVFEKKRELDI